MKINQYINTSSTSINTTDQDSSSNTCFYKLEDIPKTFTTTILKQENR